MTVMGALVLTCGNAPEDGRFEFGDAVLTRSYANALPPMAAPSDRPPEGFVVSGRLPSGSSVAW